MAACVTRPALLFFLISGVSLGLSGCFLFAPQAQPGASSGSACGADLDCEKGLSCECGVCASPGSSPVACDVEVENQCGDQASVCFQACGDLTEVGESDCIDGRDSCLTGVLRADCPASTCWGEPAPGEICDNGEFICQFTYIPELEACQTFDCEGTAGRCVMDCDGTPPTSEICAGGEWACATGFPEEQCGPCVAPVPACFDDCSTMVITQSAQCDDVNGWECPIGTAIESMCCTEAGGTYFGPDDVGDIFNVTCLTGVVNVVDSFTEVTFPNLIRAETLNIWDSDAISISAPNLREVTGDLSIWNNDVLTEVSLPDLASVGNLLELSSNDILDTCVTDGIVTQVLSAGGVAEVINSNNGTGVCVPAGDAGVPDDAGPTDAGPALDAGPGPDAAAIDAGGTDASRVDAALSDAASGDAANPDAADAG